MSDQSNIPIQPAEPTSPESASSVAVHTDDAQPTGPTAGEAWGDVVARLGELGDAISAWARAAADTPENRKHLEELRAGVEDIARQANEAISAAANSDFGRQVAEGATQVGTAIGSTAQDIGQAAAPHVASAFAGIADAFGRAAEKVGQAATPHPAEPPARPAPEPPAPAEPKAASESGDDAQG